ncbi:hypothetical protein WAX74_14895 [Psychrobacillus sp. FJAT-51614]|uniref:YqgU-like 6-bladed beta-propeller domain-containing protein n=1 Tax=Psychrobacillus mangrovi TaxID=3117745 RepID=A0ABU8F7D0_9BACI
MKRIGILIVFILLLQACTETKIPVKEQVKTPITEEVSVPENTSPSLTKEIPSISMASSSFHSVIGWLSNDDIAFVLMDKGQWTVQSYSVSHDTWKVIYTSSLPIIQASIHPNKELILLHTSNNSSSAEVQIIHKNGYLVQSLTFESDELYMDWHPTNQDLIVFTTFYEDWTFNTFVYDGSTQKLQAIEVENPFVKWYDEEHLMVFRGSESSLDGYELMLYSIQDKSLKETGITHLVDVQNLGESLLYIQINEPKNIYEYRLQDKLENFIEWTSPAISNYSEWVIPTISIVNTDELFIIKPIQAGNIDEIEQKGVLSFFSMEGEQELGEISTQPIDCAPNRETCLAGYEKDHWIQIKPFEEQRWLQLKE